MKILVTGVGGQLGWDVCRRLDLLGIENKGVDVGDFDLTDGEAVMSAVRAYAPDAIIHCAAYTNVEKAESMPEVCADVNGMGTLNVVRAALAVGAKLMYISTDYVFEGTGETPYEVDAPHAPQSVYGLTKDQGEEAVTSLMQRYYIVRISWVFGEHGNNFVRTMLRLGASRKELNVVCDQIGSPTYTPDLAVLLCDMIRTEKYGVYHATNEGYCSWADFAQAIMEEAGLRCVVHPVPTSEYPTVAKRPLNSRMSKRSLDDAGFCRLPSWQDALHRYIEVLQDAHA